MWIAKSRKREKIACGEEKRQVREIGCYGLFFIYKGLMHFSAMNHMEHLENLTYKHLLPEHIQL